MLSILPPLLSLIFTKSDFVSTNEKVVASNDKQHKLINNTNWCVGINTPTWWTLEEFPYLLTILAQDQRLKIEGFHLEASGHVLRECPSETYGGALTGV